MKSKIKNAVSDCGPIMQLDDLDKAALLTLARQSIAAQFEDLDPLSGITLTSNMKQNASCFITLKKKGQLRGCIGNMQGDQPLYTDVMSNAVKAAMGDPRFPSLRSDELPQCGLSISVLSASEPVRSIEAIELGKHGLTIQKGLSRGVFLPQVPIEQRWNRQQYLEFLCRKAGLPTDAWQTGAELEWFTALVFSDED